MRWAHVTKVLALLSLTSSTVQAQTFNQSVTFGDSTVDSGWYRNSTSGTAGFDARIQTAISQGGQVSFTTTPGQMSSQVLAGYFGLSANPANQPGGTNYATGGARNALGNAGTTLFLGAIPTTTQISNYLTASGGVANANALFLISTGGNDQTFAFNSLPLNGQAAVAPPGSGGARSRTEYFNNASSALVTSVTTLWSAGARNIIVSDVDYSQALGFGAPGEAISLQYIQNVWNGLAANGVNFIPADRNAVMLAIIANPGAFGITNVEKPTSTSAFTGACARPTGVTGAWALLCSPQNLVAPNAQNTYLWADNQHLTAAGQKIMGDYFYSLVVAPSQVSMLAENAVKTRTALVGGIQEQIDVSLRNRGPSILNAWVTGDVSHLAIDNYPGFPNDPSTPVSLTAGIDVKVAPGIMVGGAVSMGRNSPDWGDNRGKFSQEEGSGSIYAALRSGIVQFDAVASFGSLRDRVQREVPLGISIQPNDADTHGHNTSLALRGRLDLPMGGFTHGPVVGLVLQQIGIDGFAEHGNVTSLTFASQTRNSAVTALGYRIGFNHGIWEPYAQIVWNHELADTDRDIVTSLTTITAPSWRSASVSLGKDWGTATVGTTVQLGQGIKGVASVTGQFGQNDVQSYGARLGINVAF